MKSALLFWFAATFALADVDFVKDVQPILRRNCYGCHGAALQTSGLRLDQGPAALKGGYGGPSIKPGDSAHSALIARVSGEKGVPVMPPAGKRLTPEEIQTLKTWIDEGAKFPAVATTTETKPRPSTHWAFQPVKKPAGTIDSLIRAELAKRGIQPSPAADRRVLLRRLSLDLIGLPPTPAELDAFVSDQRKDAYERQVDRLLASPHFGEKWARQWLDQARYADSDGYEKDWVRPYAWRWRNWVIDSLNRDQPFDQFTIEQIAGDLLPGATTEQKVATGFHRNTLFNREGGVDTNQFVFEAKLDRTSTVGTVWLGLSVGCAQCHDHKFDPISQKEMYSLFAFFDNTEEVDIDAPLPGEIGPWLRTQANYRAKRQALLTEYKVPELQAAWEKEILYTIAHLGERTDWDLAWDCVQKLTEGGDGGKIVQIPPARRTPRQQQILTDHFIRNAHFAYGSKRWKEMKLDELDRKLDDLKKSFPQLTQAMVVEEEPGLNPKSHLRIRGDWKALGIEVEPGTLAALPPLKAAGPKATRLDLARWLVSRDHPLTARVAVNRLWQDLFGAGLVKTPDDFGTRAEQPVYPEVLDLLAASFMENGWSRKELIRTIVLSATYQQSSHARPDLKEIDPQNTLLARQSRLRLPAEAIRDSALATAGLLTTRIGGPSIRPPQPAGVMELSYASRYKGSAWVESTGEDRYRRGLYVQFLRTTSYPMLMNFDAPKSAVAACRRDRSNTPLQALNLLNDPVFVEAAQALAHRVLPHQSTEARLTHAMQLAVGRAPTDRERQRLSAYLADQQRLLADDKDAIAKLAPVEAPGSTPLETATWTLLASAILNLEEFITRE
jgi:hypothetical protein